MSRKCIFCESENVKFDKEWKKEVIDCGDCDKEVIITELWGCGDCKCAFATVYKLAVFGSSSYEISKEFMKELNIDDAEPSPEELKPKKKSVKVRSED